MTGYVIDALSRLCCPALAALVIFESHYLRMRCRADNAKLHALLHAILAADKSLILRVKHASLDSVPYVIAECANPVNLCHVCLQSLLRRWDRTIPASPAFTVHHNRRINLVKCCPHSIHCLNVMHCHQIKAESVNVVLLRPVNNRIHDIFADHGAVRSRLVSTAGCIGIILTYFSVKIIWHCFLIP